MAQQAGVSAKDMYVGVSTDGTTFTDVSGWANAVEVSDGERKTGGYFTFDGDTEGLTRGKRSKLKIKVNIIYTEGGADPYATAKAAYENNTPLYVRWSPKGNTTGNKRYTTSAGAVTDPPYGGGEAEEADPIMLEVNVEASSLTESAVP